MSDCTYMSWVLLNLIFCVIDLVPKENVERWIQCLQQEFPVVAFKASTQIKDKTVVRGALFIFYVCNHFFHSLDFFYHLKQTAANVYTFLL